MVVQKCIKLSIIFWKNNKNIHKILLHLNKIFKNKYNNKVRLTRDIQTALENNTINNVQHVKSKVVPFF